MNTPIPETTINNETALTAWTFLEAPYAHWPAAKILAYFQQRNQVHYFPVLDEEQAERRKVDQILENRFDFNDEAYQLEGNFDWTDNPSSDKEWQILRHKFYYAVGMGAYFQQTGDRRYLDKWLTLTESWIDTVPLDFLSSDVTGRRVQNWIFAHYYFVSQPNPPAISPEFYLKFLQSLSAQVVYLSQNLTPGRNHRTIELYAIFLAAVVFPELKGAAQWLAFAKEELLLNIQTDLLADGVHCELSTDYHHLVVKNYLGIRRLAQLNQLVMPPEMDDLLQKALTFALYCHKPDGDIPSLSDGDSRSFLYLLEQGYQLYQHDRAATNLCNGLRYVASQGQQGTPPPQRSKAFSEGGYYILRSGWGNGAEPYGDERYLIFDCGPLGRGNHGHLDLLNIEMAAYGQSLIVDPGRYTYDESGETNWRVRFRGTSYHNTVQVDDEEQTRYIFHKTRFKIRGPEPDFQLKAFISAEGYDFLHGVARSHQYDAVHQRKIFFQWPDYWIVSDFLTADQPHQYDLRFHLADNAQGQTKLFPNKNGSCLVEAPHLVLAQPTDDTITPTLETGYVSRSYGFKHPAPVVRYTNLGANCTYHTVLYPYQVEKPEITMQTLAVQTQGQGCEPHQATAVLITVRQQGQTYHDYYLTADSEQPYQFADFQYDGSLLFLRLDEAGQVVKLIQQPGRLLTRQNVPIANQE